MSECGWLKIVGWGDHQGRHLKNVLTGRKKRHQPLDHPYTMKYLAVEGRFNDLFEAFCSSLARPREAESFWLRTLQYLATNDPISGAIRCSRNSFGPSVLSRPWDTVSPQAGAAVYDALVGSGLAVPLTTRCTLVDNLLSTRCIPVAQERESDSGEEESPPYPPPGGGPVASPEEPEAEARPTEEPDPHLAAVYDVHGRDPKAWPGGALKWRTEAERCRKAGVTAEAWKALLVSHPLAKPWEIADDAVREAEAALEAKKRHEADLARSERDRRARFEYDCRVVAAKGPERVAAWLEKIPPHRKAEAEAILNPPRAAS